ncbi:MAG: glutamine amidotransferase [Aureliella sp.]
MIMTAFVFPVAQISSNPVFGWFTLIVLSIIMLASLWLTLTSRDLSPKGRMILAAIRLAAIGILLLGWLRPSLVTTTERESPGAIAVLLDQSQSMTLPSSDSDETRWQAQQRLWKQIADSTSLKIGRSSVVPYLYDSALSVADPASEQLTAPTPPDTTASQLTDLGTALQQLGRLQLDPPLRGVILVGDFTQTQIPPSIDPTSVARQMAQLDQPILGVGIGPKGRGQYRDVALEGMPEEIAAFTKKELRIPLVIRAGGMAGESIKVQMTLKASGKPDVILGSRTVKPSGGDETLPIEFGIVAPEKGDYLLQATASVDSREQVVSNNTQYGFISVREGGVKVLYLESLRPEMRSLRRSLDQSLEFEIDVPTELLSLRARGRTVDLSRKYNVSNYDAFIIGDLAARELGRDMQTAIRNEVERGAGLLLLGGTYSFSSGGYSNSPLRRLFPIDVSGRPQPFDAPLIEGQHVLGKIPMQPTRPHPITRLAESAPDNERIWESLPPLNQINRLGRVDIAAGTSVLLESPQRDPILVTSEGRGRGRVMAFAGDTTWKWRLEGHKKLHQRFWRQALLWLVRKDSIDAGFKLSLPRRRYQLGEAPEIDIEWFGGVADAAAPGTFRVALSRDGTWLSDLATTKESDALFSTKLDPVLAPGLYSAKLTADGADGKKLESEIAFVVSDQSIELTGRMVDEQMLRSITAANSAAGGRVVPADEIDDAIAWLRDRQAATKVTSIEKRRLGDAAWDSWLYLILFCGLMSLEWSLRKAWQLP